MIDFDRIEYKFKLTSVDDFELNVDLHAKGGLFDKILEKSKSALAKKGLPIADDIVAGEGFEIPAEDRYFNLIRTALNNPLKNIRRDIKKDSKGKILILNEKVTNCVFIPVDDYWNIKVKLEGAYADKR